MPADYPDYPHHAQIAAYFDTYVDHFGFRDHDPLQHARGDGVARRRRHRTRSRPTMARCASTTSSWSPMATTGMRSGPSRPSRAQRASTASSSTPISYIEPSIFEDKNVVVLGMGNSAMDIAVESSYVAGNTFLAARRGAWIIPKYLFGQADRPLQERPADPVQDPPEGRPAARQAPHRRPHQVRPAQARPSASARRIRRSRAGSSIVSSTAASRPSPTSRPWMATTSSSSMARVSRSTW